MTLLFTLRRLRRSTTAATVSFPGTILTCLARFGFLPTLPTLLIIAAIIPSDSVRLLQRRVAYGKHDIPELNPEHA
jgi:hypothetical protein